MSNYDDLTDELFDELLAEVIDRAVNDTEKPSELLAIPGIYEVLSEFFHDAVLGLYDERFRESDESAEDDDDRL